MKKVSLFIFFTFITLSSVFAQSEGVIKAHYDNGQIKYEGKIDDDGKPVGRFVTYYDNGQIESEENYNEEGKLDGESKMYYKNGQLKVKKYYDNGDIITWTGYTEKGLQIEETLHESSREIENLDDAILISVLPAYLTNDSELEQEKTDDVITNDLEPFTSVDQMPTFIGGEIAFRKFVTENLQYPIEAIVQGVQGEVVLRLVVTKDGDILDPVVLRGFDFDSDCVKEALRIVKLMPKWEPGRLNGETVPTYFTLNIVFRLK